jgi:hypothetical protein
MKQEHKKEIEQAIEKAADNYWTCIEDEKQPDCAFQAGAEFMYDWLRKKHLVRHPHNIADVHAHD